MRWSLVFHILIQAAAMVVAILIFIDGTAHVLHGFSNFVQYSIVHKHAMLHYQVLQPSFNPYPNFTRRHKNITTYQQCNSDVGDRVCEFVTKREIKVISCVIEVNLRCLSDQKYIIVRISRYRWIQGVLVNEITNCQFYVRPLITLQFMDSMFF